MNDDDLVTSVRHGQWEAVRDELTGQRLQAVDGGGSSLLVAAAAISDPHVRLDVLNELLDRGIDVPTSSRTGDGVLSTLLSRSPGEPEATARTLVRLLEAGADTGYRFGPGRTPSMELAYADLPEESLTKVYDLWFARDDLDLRHVSAEGADAVALAEALDRDEFVARARRWLEAHPEEDA